MVFLLCEHPRVRDTLLAAVSIQNTRSRRHPIRGLLCRARANNIRSAPTDWMCTRGARRGVVDDQTYAQSFRGDRNQRIEKEREVEDQERSCLYA